MEKNRIRVDGIPTDIPASRVKDKLTIHFLRSKFGGAEVERMDVVQGAAAYAIVTFPDEQVAENVLKIKDHTLQVNDKIYNLVISEVNGNVDLDEVFEKLSLTVNYGKFPEKHQNLLKNLMETHPYATFHFDEKSMTCTISGAYAEIQTTAQEILSKLGIVYTVQKQISTDSRRKAKIERRKNYPEPQAVAQALDYPYVPLSGTAVEEMCSVKPESDEQLEEPFVWETDIFLYMHEFHSIEYQEILNTYHILAVHESFDDITTIYLKTASGGKTHLGELRCARSKLMGLYRGLELLLRKEQIEKRNVYGDQHFYETLSTDLKRLYPMLYFHADEEFLYLIGNGIDISHAQQYIFNLHTKFDRMSGDLDKQFGESGASNISTGLPHSLSPTKKHESGVGSRIAASFNAPTTQSINSAKSHMDEEHLVSSTSPRRLPQDRENDLGDMISLKSIMADDLQKNEAASCSRPDEKSESLAMPSANRQDVLPALKIVREDLRNSGATPKPTGDEEVDERKLYLASKHLADERYAQLTGTEPFQVISFEHEAFLKTEPGSQDEKSTHPQEFWDFPEDTKNRSTSEKTDYYTLTETFARSPYTSDLLTQGINVSPRNVPVLLEPHYGEQGISTEDGVVQYQGSSPQLRTPAVGQESNSESNSICSNCKNIGKTIQTSSGQMQCVKCFDTSVISAPNETAKAPLIASMSHTAMSLRLPGYEGDTSLKIIYEVADGVQGAGDPQPGCQYKGGRFEAYLPDNREGRKLLSLLQRALDQGLIFHVKSFEVGEVTWYKIPHKTSPDGGKAKNGYPDLTYVRDTIALLHQYGID
ncbi:uncharacterized protein LOC130296516 isoform X2 [Hyla sarda]|uniref:uncharacterized protein LOC130296516 isoform X2 n=1 Tax=Hyla sarda TaxID=327740 RepID=UPI0024C3BA3C|nr:uncharacterized protein LOC130296516 isoform X2 [Hyla sarda]